MSYIIYGWDTEDFYCNPCQKAKKILDVYKEKYIFKKLAKNYPTEEHVSNKETLTLKLNELDTKLETLPMIFTSEGKLIGGFTDLKTYILCGNKSNW